jgi:hypothetical protein
VLALAGGGTDSILHTLPFPLWTGIPFLASATPMNIVAVAASSSVLMTLLLWLNIFEPPWLMVAMK